MSATFLLCGFSTSTLSAATLRVGPGRSFSRPCQAIAAANHGDAIEIDAATYVGDVCQIQKNNLHIKGVGGRAVINANNKSAGDKAAWVTVGNDLIIENIEFTNVYSTAMNGAGIRAEGTNLTIRNCRFYNNQMGIVSADNLKSDILIEYSEFGPSRRQDGGLAHNIYISRARRFTLRYSYSHHSSVGQLVKSRASENRILYNRISSEATGTTSYEISLPNGGLSAVIGNLIQQGPAHQNPILLTYLEEGMDPAITDNRLFVINNTFVNDAANGYFTIIRKGAAKVVLQNNLFVGNGAITDHPAAIQSGNVQTNNRSFFVNPAQYDYRLLPGSPALNKGIAPFHTLVPRYAYAHPLCAQQRTTAGALDAGAFELQGVSNTGCKVSPGTLTATPVLSLNEASSGSTMQNRVNIDGPAPAGGAQVMLESSHPGIEAVPTMVVIPEGEYTAAFETTLHPVSTDVNVTTKAQLSSAEGSATQVVKPATPPR